LALWRDASPAQIKNDLHLTLQPPAEHAGRPEWIVFEEERYRSTRAFAVELDARQFETDLRMARAALAQSKDAAPLARRAGALPRRLPRERDGRGGDWYLEHPRPLAPSARRGTGARWERARTGPLD